MKKKKELLKNTAILTVGKVCTQLVSFLLLPMYTSILNTTDYGTYDLLITYASLIFPIVSCQYGQGAFRFLISSRKDEREKKEIISTTIIMTNIVVCIFLAICIGIRCLLNLQYVYFFLLYTVLQIYITLLMQIARGIGNNKIYAISNFISSSGTVIFNIVFLVVLQLKLAGLMWGTILAMLCSLFFLGVELKPWNYIKIDSFSLSCLKKISFYSLPLIPDEISWWIVNASDRAIISLFLGVAANGIYVIANKFSSFFISFYSVFNMAWAENLSVHINDEDKDEYLNKMMSEMFTLFASASICIVAVMPFLFPLMVNEKYNTGYNQVIILLYAMIFRVIVGLYSGIYVASMNSKKMAFIDAGAAIINIVINIILIGKIGLYAASLSTAIAYFIMAIVTMVDVREKMHIEIKKKAMLLVAIWMGIQGLTYYINRLSLNILMMNLSFVLAIFFNKKMLLLMFREIVKKVSFYIKSNN